MQQWRTSNTMRIRQIIWYIFKGNRKNYLKISAWMKCIKTGNSLRDRFFSQHLSKYLLYVFFVYKNIRQSDSHKVIFFFFDSSIAALALLAHVYTCIISSKMDNFSSNMLNTMTEVNYLCWSITSLESYMQNMLNKGNGNLYE